MQKERSLPLEYTDGLPSREAIESMEGALEHLVVAPRERPYSAKLPQARTMSCLSHVSNQ